MKTQSLLVVIVMVLAFGASACTSLARIGTKKHNVSVGGSAQ